MCNIEQTQVCQRRNHLVMHTKYDIFRNLRHGIPVRITTVATHGEVEQTLHALEWVEPGDYFVRETASGQIVYGRATASEPL